MKAIYSAYSVNFVLVYQVRVENVHYLKLFFKWRMQFLICIYKIVRQQIRRKYNTLYKVHYMFDYVYAYSWCASLCLYMIVIILLFIVCTRQHNTCYVAYIQRIHQFHFNLSGYMREPNWCARYDTISSYRHQSR